MPLKNQPSKRFVEVNELAALALFPCSDIGGSVTGAALPVGRKDSSLRLPGRRLAKRFSCCQKFLGR